MKYGVTSSLTWDFTVNTDFSQVEADEQQVNLTRFNLFFPEKRDFFLENSGIFQFGAAARRRGGGGGGGGGGGRRTRSQDMHPVLQPPHRALDERRGDSDPRRHPADRPCGRPDRSAR